MVYANGGYYHTYGEDPLNPTSSLYKDAGYEGVRSFAIVTTKVTDEILQYWLDQKDKTNSNGTLLYANGPMKAAYGTFLTSLMMIKCHDMIADQAAAQYNVNWTRTTPIMVSVFDDAYRTVITLECDHRFGMDVTGAAQNVTAFRYACSSAINPLEHYVMETLFPGGNGTSIVMGIGEEIFNGLMPSIFLSNGYLVFKSSVKNMFLIFDPTTGILWDVMIDNGTVSGAYCFSNLQTEWAYDLGEKLKSSNLSVQPPWLGMVGGISLGASSAAVGEGSLLGAGVLASEVPLIGWMVGGGLILAAVLNHICDQYGWLPPEQARQILGNAFPLTFGTINLFLYDEPPTTLIQLQKAYWKSAYLLMAIAESDDTELYEYLNDIGRDPKKIIDESNNAFKKAEYLAKKLSEDPEVGGAVPPDDRVTRFLGFFVNKIREGYGKLKTGDYVGGAKDIAIGTSGINMAVVSWFLYELWPEGLWPKNE
ncbi:MAG: hypothetical protein HVN35_08815 [Methanobacteriaceae archaeon]|nr:hypothetical protein [Methanobacteriaceae archaeon]